MRICRASQCPQHDHINDCSGASVQGLASVRSAFACPLVEAVEVHGFSLDRLVRRMLSASPIFLNSPIYAGDVAPTLPHLARYVIFAWVLDGHWKRDWQVIAQNLVDGLVESAALWTFIRMRALCAHARCAIWTPCGAGARLWRGLGSRHDFDILHCLQLAGTFCHGAPTTFLRDHLGARVLLKPCALQTRRLGAHPMSVLCGQIRPAR